MMEVTEKLFIPLELGGPMVWQSICFKKGLKYFNRSQTKYIRNYNSKIVLGWCQTSHSDLFKPWWIWHKNSSVFQHLLKTSLQYFCIWGDSDWISNQNVSIHRFFLFRIQCTGVSGSLRAFSKLISLMEETSPLSTNILLQGYPWLFRSVSCCKSLILNLHRPLSRWFTSTDSQTTRMFVVKTMANVPTHV